MADTSGAKGPSTFRLIREFFADWRQTWRTHVTELSDSWHRIKSGLIWTSVLLTLNFTYCIFGGLLFASLEGWHESRYKCGALKIRRQFIDELYVKAGELHEDDWRELARENLVDFEDQLHEAFRQGLNSYSGKRTWGFWDAVVFSLTTVSTIGYGHITPVTILGRLSTIGYAVIGIPLFLILLTDSGQLLTRILKFGYVYAVRFSQTTSGQRFLHSGLVQKSQSSAYAIREKVATRLTGFPSLQALLYTHLQISGSKKIVIDDNFDIPALLAFLLLLVYTSFGAVLFYVGEDWSPLEAFYFVFISITTIGFGDYVPQHPMALITAIVYLVFGLALTGLCLSTIQSEIIKISAKARSRLAAKLGLTLQGSEEVTLELAVKDKES